MEHEQEVGQGNPSAGIEDATYDKAAKEFLALRQILAMILHRLVPEFRSFSLDFIAHECIEGKPRVGEVPVDPGRTNQKGIPQKLRGIQTEQSERNEGWVTFDVLFYACVPGTDKRIKLIINIEAQRNDPRYSLLKRAQFYLSRLVSSQKERDFSGQDYDSICKVYSIWLCFYLPEGEGSSINRYHTVEEVLYGNHHEPKEDYDFTSITVVHIGDDEPTDEFLRFLQIVFIRQATEMQKAEQVKKEFGIELEEDTRKGLETMCNLSSGLKDRAREEGIAIGEARGRVAAWAESVRSLMASMKWTAQQAVDAVAVPPEFRQKVLEQV